MACSVELRREWSVSARGGLLRFSDFTCAIMVTIAESVELAIARSAWEEGLRPLLVQPGGWAVGELRRLETTKGLRLVAERLSPVTTLP